MAIKPNFSGYIALAAGITYFGAKKVRQNSKIYSSSGLGDFQTAAILTETRQSKHCGFSIYISDNSKSKSMVRLVREEKMVLSGLIFARKIARMILNQNI